jgi:hypothetical protein
MDIFELCPFILILKKNSLLCEQQCLEVEREVGG